MANRRTIRSKAGRYLLLKKFGFKCRVCGCDKLEELELDHVIPYVITGDTNIHDLQVLCKRCNRKKGKKIMSMEFRPRKHQAEAARIVSEIVSGYRPSIELVIADVTCGGGKSSLPVILAAGLRIPIMWCHPRKALGGQAEDAFLDPRLRAYFKHDLTIRQSTNDIDPMRNTNGYAITYAALEDDSARINLDFARAREGNFALVLDEPQQLVKDCAAEKRIRPIHELARITLMMSGTWARHDKQRVAYAPYEPVRDGESRLSFLNTVEIASIRYTRQDALREKAILPSEIYFYDGRGEYRRNGKEEQYESLRNADDPKAALYNALHTELSREILNEGMIHWRAYKISHPRSKVLIVAADINSAKEFYKYLRDDRGISSHNIGIATSDDTPDALKKIDQFRRADRGGIDILITVGMAYIGLDVPAITHTFVLTYIRSVPYLTQLFARGARVDYEAGPYEKQLHFMYAPDDPLIHYCTDELLADQQAVAKEQDGQTEPTGGGGGGGGGVQDFIRPGRSSYTESHAQELKTGDTLGVHEAMEAIAVQQKLGALNISPDSLFDLAALLKEVKQGVYEQARPSAQPSTSKRPSEIEKEVSSDTQAYIEDYTKAATSHLPNDKDRYDLIVQMRVKLNGELKRLIGKVNREAWNTDDHQRAIDYLLQHYPILKERHQ